MIPRKIHYCWFGSSAIPEEFQRYIATWKTHNPDYEIIRWDETNSPMHLPYMATASKHRKWANLANFVRLHVLYREGGIYLDTDVEVLRNFDALLENACFLGFESGSREGEKLLVNNAVLGAVPRHPFIKKCKNHLLDHFDGTENPPDSSPILTTRVLSELGLRSHGEQETGGIKLYPVDYFYPLAYKERDPARISKNSYTIHHWAATWKGSRKSRTQLLLFADKLKYAAGVLSKRLLMGDAAVLAPFMRFFPEIQAEKLCNALSRSGEVLHGPFRGMKFSHEQEYALSSFLPKIVGSYESCLHPVIHDILDRDYSAIYNVGCAEGYYTAGFAGLFPNASIFAYDINPLAVSLTRMTFLSNGLKNPIQIFNEPLNADDLAAGDFPQRSLIFCNIEGGERRLFTEQNAPNLCNVDMIIELHDFLEYGTKKYIVGLFEDSHNVQITREAPVDFSRFPCLLDLPVSVALRVVNEKRPVPMEWAVLLCRTA